MSLFTKWRFEYFKSDSELSSQPLFVTKMFSFHSNTRKMRHLLSMWIKVVLHIFSLFWQLTLIMMYWIFHYIMYVPINCGRSQSILKTENLMFFVRKKCRLWGVNLISQKLVWKFYPVIHINSKIYNIQFLFIKRG